MIFAVDGHMNSVEIDNGDRLDNPSRIGVSTVCTGEYTEFVITFPEGCTVRANGRTLKSKDKEGVQRLVVIKVPKKEVP